MREQYIYTFSFDTQARAIHLGMFYELSEFWADQPVNRVYVDRILKISRTFDAEISKKVSRIQPQKTVLVK